MERLLFIRNEHRQSSMVYRLVFFRQNVPVLSRGGTSRFFPAERPGGLQGEDGCSSVVPRNNAHPWHP